MMCLATADGDIVVVVVFIVTRFVITVLLDMIRARQAVLETFLNAT